MIIRKKFELSVLVYFIFALFSFWMAAQLPYTNDDWDWGLSNGIEQLLYATINSRYAGNFFAVIMTRSPFVKTVLIGLGYFLIPFLLSRSALHGKSSSNGTYFLSFIMASIMLFMMPINVWAQTYGWVSGFANYGLSVFFVMFWVYQLNVSFDETPDSSDEDICCSLLSFLFSLTGQLFIENLALYNVLLAFALVFIYKKRFNKLPINILSALFGALIGLGIMFSSKLYGDLLADGNTLDGVRRMIWSEGTDYRVMLYNFSVQASLLSKGLYENNTFICLFTLLTLSMQLVKRAKENNNISTISFLLLNIFYIFYFSIGKIYTASNDSYAVYKYLIVILINFLYYILVLFEIVLLYNKNVLKKYKLLFIWSSAPVLIAPLILTLDNGARLYFTSNIFLYLFCLIEFFDIWDDLPQKMSSAFRAIATALLLVLMFSYGSKYYDIGQHSREQILIINQAVNAGDKEITLVDYPYDSLLWASRPYNDSRLEYFKEFYGIPENTVVSFVENHG